MILKGTPGNLARLARHLAKGGLVAVPTETVYGLAADALNARACAKIFRAKGRPASDPLIVHIHSPAQLGLVARPNEAAQKLAGKFWPGPLTMVLPKTAAVPAVVTSGRDSVAVRMPSHPLFRRLIRLAGRPLAAPSANPFGYVSPTTAEHVRDGLGRKVDYILDGGPAKIGIESTIVDLRDPRRPVLLRPGAVTRKQLERAIGRKVAAEGPPKPGEGGSLRSPVFSALRRGKRAGGKLAPGMFARHYSPHTPVVLHDPMPAVRSREDAWLFVARPKDASGKNVFWLDARGNLRGAARRLFATLRSLDGKGFGRIHAELARGEGMAEAINDRLRRAAGGL